MHENLDFRKSFWPERSALLIVPSYFCRNSVTKLYIKGGCYARIMLVYNSHVPQTRSIRVPQTLGRLIMNVHLVMASFLALVAAPPPEIGCLRKSRNRSAPPGNPAFINRLATTTGGSGCSKRANAILRPM